MSYANPWKSYVQVSTQTAPPGQLVLMLYEGAIRFLERAVEGFSKDDPAEFHMTVHNNVQRAQDIIRELNWCLNMEQGGELAATLRRLYDYLDRRLMESNLKKDPSGIHEVIRRLTVLKDAWATILGKQSERPAIPEPFGLGHLAAA
jgi:flagellar protein FliS